MVMNKLCFSLCKLWDILYVSISNFWRNSIHLIRYGWTRFHVLLCLFLWDLILSWIPSNQDQVNHSVFLLRWCDLVYIFLHLCVIEWFKNDELYHENKLKSAEQSRQFEDILNLYFYLLNITFFVSQYSASVSRDFIWIWNFIFYEM